MTREEVTSKQGDPTIMFLEVTIEHHSILSVSQSGMSATESLKVCRVKRNQKVFAMVLLKTKRGYFLTCLIALLCLFDIGSSSTCNSDSDCSSGDCGVEGYCIPDALFSSFSVYDICATFSILIGSIVAAGGGLGGGGIFVPIFILIMNLDSTSAAALSQATIFGGSIVNLIMNFRQHHPLRKHRPLTDLTTILIFEPMLLGGTIIGVILNVIFPDPIILACLFVTVSF